MHAQGFTIEGTVRDSKGSVVGDAAIWLITFDDVRSAQTDPDGRFLFSDQPAGDVTLVAYRESMALGGADLLVLDDTSVELDVAPAIETPLRVVDARLRPVAGARLLRLRINDAFAVPAARLTDHGLPSVRSDRDGRLVIPFLAAGDYARIEIDHRRFAKEVLPTLPAGTAVDAVLPFGEPVRGRVLTPEGEGAEGAAVTIFRSGEDRTAVVGDAVAGPQGFYTAVVPPGQYWVTARHGTHGMAQPVSVDVAYEQDPIAPDLHLAATTPVSGATVDEAGNGVAGVRVRYVQDRMALATAVSDATGRYSIRANRGEGVLRFVAPPHQAILGEDRINLTIAGDRPLVVPAITVAELPTIVGTVSGERVEQLDEVLVSTRNLQTNLYGRPGAEGRFEIELDRFPPEGILSLRAEHGYRFLRGDVEIHVFNDPEPAIVLEPFQPDLSTARDAFPNNLRGRVGKPAPELAVERWINVEEPVTLDGLNGKVVVLTLWASFDTSGPARDRMRELERWHAIYGDGSVAFVAVHEGTTPPEQVEAAVEEWGITFPVARDTEAFETFDRYNTNFVPQTVLIDKDGVVRHYDVDGRLGELIKDLRRR